MGSPRKRKVPNKSKKEKQLKSTKAKIQAKKTKVKKKHTKPKSHKMPKSRAQIDLTKPKIRGRPIVKRRPIAISQKHKKQKQRKSSWLQIPIPQSVIDWDLQKEEYQRFDLCSEEACEYDTSSIWGSFSGSTISSVEDLSEKFEEPGVEEVEEESTKLTSSSDSYDYIEYMDEYTQRKRYLIRFAVRAPNIDDISLTESESIETVEEETMSATSVAIETETEETEATAEYFEFDFETASFEESNVFVERQTMPIVQIFERMSTEEPESKVEVEATAVHESPWLERRMLENDAVVFLNALIEAVVDASEHVGAEDMLRKTLNKVKLFRELCIVLAELRSESKVLAFLHQKGVLYFRRMRDLRPIKPESEEVHLFNVEKYKEVACRLNNLLTYESNLKELHAKRILEAELMIIDLEARLERANSDFEAAMRQTMSWKKDQDDALKSYIEGRIKEMSNLRKDISGARKVVIRRQHATLALSQKVSHVEFVGGQFRLRDYERVLTEESSLFRKIEEKTEGLSRMRHTLFKQTCKAAHIKGKQELNLLQFVSQLEALSKTDADVKDFENYVHQLRLDGIRMKREIQQKTDQYGLIGRKSLLIDFDKTVERGQKMKSKVDALKSEILKLENIINTLQKRASDSNGTKIAPKKSIAS